ncbi:hypothetical protein Pmar_PMAR014817, partial [Perkinsus marinus ATCC 50983]
GELRKTDMCWKEAIAAHQHLLTDQCDQQLVTKVLLPVYIESLERTWRNRWKTGWTE